MRLMPHMNDSDTDANRERVARSNRATGRVLTGLGLGLVGIALLLLMLGAVLDILAGHREDAGRYDAATSLSGTAAVLATIPPAVLVLLATCCLIPGEQLRRGQIGRNPDVLSRASHVSRFQPLPTRQHVGWVLIGLLVTVPLLALPMVAWFTGWPVEQGDDADFTGFWTIYGGLGLGFVAGAAVSLVKKTAFTRRQRQRKVVAEAPGRAFWRWFTYRWRLDIWFAGVGGVLLALSPTFIASDVGPDSAGAPPGAHIVAMGAMALAGLLLIAVGVVATLNFWRAGEELGSGESAR